MLVLAELSEKILQTRVSETKITGTTHIRNNWDFCQPFNHQFKSSTEEIKENERFILSYQGRSTQYLNI